MKIAAVLAVAGLAFAAQADVYSDATNDLFNNGFGHLDISSVAVTHDASNIYFSINTRSSPVATNWGKYCIAINTVGSSINSSGNGWGRPVNWNGQGVDFWIGSWADGPGFGGELRQMTNSSNNDNTLLAATYVPGPGISGSTTAAGQLITVSRALLGLNSDQTFAFDVITSGGGGNDPGVDHLSRADLATTDWSVPSTAGSFLSYTIPAPGAAGLLGLAGLAAARRRRA
jgi:hypothetical protein